LVRLGQEELIVNSKQRSPDETARRFGMTESLRKAQCQRCSLQIPVVRIRNLEHKVQVASGRARRVDRVALAGDGEYRALAGAWKLMWTTKVPGESALILRRAGIGSLTNIAGTSGGKSMR
jgi:hypothetical protein